jgi:hypothetical protein
MTSTDTPTVPIEPTGRTDLADLFLLSDVLRVTTLTQTPFLAFTQHAGAVRVQIIDSAARLLQLPDETPVMVQWRGQWRSDFFQITVADVRSAKEARR